MFKKTNQAMKYSLDRKKIVPTILQQTREDDNIIYGGQALMKQVPAVVRRGTVDYDIFSPKPRQSANKLERNLDKKFDRDQFYVKEAIHKGTFKVMDRMYTPNNTKDDVDVADYTKPERKPKTTRIDGIRYVRLSEVKKDKKKSLADKESAFRHTKDRADLNIINTGKKLRTTWRRKLRW